MNEPWVMDSTGVYGVRDERSDFAVFAGRRGPASLRHVERVAAHLVVSKGSTSGLHVVDQQVT